MRLWAARPGSSRMRNLRNGLSLDLQIYEGHQDAGGYCFLHICKDQLNMDRYKDYGPYADVVNWGVYEAPFSLEDGRKMFAGKTIMGAFPTATAYWWTDRQRQ